MKKEITARVASTENNYVRNVARALSTQFGCFCALDCGIPGESIALECGYLYCNAKHFGVSLCALFIRRGIFNAILKLGILIYDNKTRALCVRTRAHEKEASKKKVDEV